MSGMFNSLILVPIVILMKLFINEVSLLSPRIAQAWSTPPKPITDQEYFELANYVQHEEFNQTLDAILIPRVPGTRGHQTVKEYIENRMTHLGWEVTEDKFTAQTPIGNVPFINIIATLDPSACKRLVIACHYDSKISPQGFLGATDSAVPCAMMIQMTQSLDGQLKRHQQQSHDTTLQFIFFDGEEAFRHWTRTDSLYGSRHLADQWNRVKFPQSVEDQAKCSKFSDLNSELDRMEVMVLIDLIGDSNPKFYSYFQNTHSLHTRLIRIEKKLNDLQLIEPQSSGQTKTEYFINQLKYSYIEDDHIPFYRRGVPIVHVIPSPFPDVWHTEYDNKQYLNHQAIINLIKIFKAFITQYLHL